MQRELARDLLEWASKRCPCGEPPYGYDEPKVCPLCDAHVDKDSCKAVPATFPRKFLERLRDAANLTPDDPLY
jgi:hypothetical protein